jgi:hypothetical protein
LEGAGSKLAERKTLWQAQGRLGGGCRCRHPESPLF